MAIKQDISKEFDKVECKFLDSVMRQMGFSDTWCRWIHTCISSYTYSVLFNGDPTDSIQPQREIRQGDPISLYVYIICTEGLSQLIKKVIQNQKLHEYKASRGGPAISHLFFCR